MNIPKVYARFCEMQRNAKISDDREERCVHACIPAGTWGHDPNDTIALTKRELIFAYRCLARIYPSSTTIRNTLRSLLRGYKPARKIPRRPRKPWPAEVRAKMSASHRGKTFSAESRMKMSRAKAGKPQSEAHVAARVKARKARGPWFSDEARANLSEARKRVVQATATSKQSQAVTSTNNWSTQ